MYDQDGRIYLHYEILFLLIRITIYTFVKIAKDSHRYFYHHTFANK